MLIKHDSYSHVNANPISVRHVRDRMASSENQRTVGHVEDYRSI